RATLALQQQPGGSLDLQVTADRRARRLEATLRARAVDIGFARLFAPGVGELGGILDGEVHARGPVTAPALSGALNLHDGRVGLPGQPTFRSITLALAFQPGRIDLRQLQARSGGDVSGTGWLQLAGFTPRRAAVSLHADHFAVNAGPAATRI